MIEAGTRSWHVVSGSVARMGRRWDFRPGQVPERTEAYYLRKGIYGRPTQSIQFGEVPVRQPGPEEVLVRGLTGGNNFNSAWAATGTPIKVHDVHKQDIHVLGSDGAGVVIATGEKVIRWKIGDEVVMDCNAMPGRRDEPEKIYGYETPDGTYAAAWTAYENQLHPKPPQLTWEEAGSYGLDFYTAHRMLSPIADKTRVQPDEVVLVWGAGGGLGVFATQLVKYFGAHPIGVISSDEKAELVRRLGAIGTIDRRRYPELYMKDGETPEAASERSRSDVKAFGTEIWRIAEEAGLGKRKSPNVVFEHPGKKTFMASAFLAAAYGRIVICAGTTGYFVSFDLRPFWMRQKTIFGSHFSTHEQAEQGNQLVVDGHIRPVTEQVVDHSQLAGVFDDQIDEKLRGKTAFLFGVPGPGLRTIGEVDAAFIGMGS